MAAGTVEKACQDCGVKFEVEVPDDLEPKWRDRAVALIGRYCESCNAKIAEKWAREEEESRRSQQEFKFRLRLEASGIPAGLRDVSFDGLDVEGREKAIAAAKRWAGGEVKGLVLAGPVGVGKTHIAACAALERLRERSVRWMSAPLLFARLGSGLGTPRRDEALSAITGSGGLVLDDIDKSRPTEYGAEHVFLAVDQRVENELPLLVTTNLSLGELAAKYPEPFGEAIASRLAGYCKAVKVAGTDRRVKRG